MRRVSTKKTAGPDQGFGWVIALICFAINFILIGVARSVGMLYVSIIEEYHVPRESALRPFSIRVAIKFLAGPLIGLLGQKYGIRRITTAGGAVAAIGSILCYFAPNIFWITVFWGVIHGLGFGLSTVLHMMIISHYFDKYKASALGLGYSGDCFGTFVFPVIIEYLLSKYDVRGTFLILGGIVLNVVPLALLLKKPPWLCEGKKRRKVISIKTQTSKTSEKTHPKELTGYKNDGFENCETDLSSSPSHLPKNTKSINKQNELPIYQEAVVMNSAVSLLNRKNNSFSSLSGSVRSNKALPEYMDCFHHRDNFERHDSLPPVLEKEANMTETQQTENENPEYTLHMNNDHERKNEMDTTSFETTGSMRKRRTSSFVGQIAQEIVHKMRSASFASQVAQDGFITNINRDNQEESEPEEDEQSEQITNERNEDQTSIDFGSSNKQMGQQLILSVADMKLSESSKEQNLKPQQDIFRTSSIKKLDSFRLKPKQQMSIFKMLLKTNTKPMFILISISMAVYAFLFIGVLTIIIDYAVDHGVDHDRGKYLVIGFSVTDLIGRLSFGQVIDRKLVKMKNYSGITMLLMGTFVTVLPLNSSFNFMMVCMCMYGFVQGGTAIMFPILVTYYMEKKEESIAMGCLNFYGGILMLLMAPMIGYFRDTTGSYDGVFYIIGGIVALVGLIWQLEPLILKFQNRKQRENVVICTRL
ncbi:monocarboxylate transporter 9-like [Stegodyphus dumicola]|uniref:monocarboxylate transporter 9-like n=1 Tax=Stegodyphus dumicola TaxID=202533 RepID=UPI0015A955F5|nr:monocarboxylate transporter 9-like [Stegodyphus dumicola]